MYVKNSRFIDNTPGVGFLQRAGLSLIFSLMILVSGCSDSGGKEHDKPGSTLRRVRAVAREAGEWSGREAGELCSCPP